MARATGQRPTLLFAAAGLLCPAVLVAIVILMRQGFVPFHDDFTGYKSLGFFLTSALCLLPAGLLASSIALVLSPRSVLAWLGVTVNLGLFAWGFLVFG